VSIPAALRIKLHRVCGRAEGDHTGLTVAKNRSGKHRWRTEAGTGNLIRALARQQPDSDIAMILNRAGKRTGKGNTWTEARVRGFRNWHGIAVY
jgi:hypothetical protein